MKLVLVGDSIVLAMFTNALGILSAGGRTITNLGVAGHTAANQLATWLASAQRGDATYDSAFIQVGINDIRTAGSVATCLSNVEAIRADMRTQNPGMKIFLGWMLPARLDPSVTGSYLTKWIPINAGYSAAGTSGATIGAVDLVVTGCSRALDDGTGALMAGFDSSDHLHPTTGGNRLNAVRLREALNGYFGLVDPTPSQIGGTATRMVGDWRRVDMPASTTLLMNRTNGNASSIQTRARGRIVGFNCSMDSLGAANAVTGAPLTVKVIRTSAQGIDFPAVTIGTVDVGESTVHKAVALGVLDFEAGDALYVQVVTTAGWTNLTCDPSIRLELLEGI